MMRKLMLLMGMILVAGCETTGDVKVLQDENRRLSGDLDSARQQNVSLQAEVKTLKGEVAELKRVGSILNREKRSRIKASSSLRAQTRSFVQDEINGMRRFLRDSDLLDYVGSEQVARSTSAGKGLILVDLGNPVPKSGTLTGVGGHFDGATAFRVKLLRAVDNRHVAVWESRLIKASAAGKSRFDFSSPVSVNQGDHIAYVFPESVGVSYDTGTGDTRIFSGDLPLGNSFSHSRLLGGSEKRAYSIGVYGFLN